MNVDKYEEYALVVRDVNKYFTDANTNGLAQRLGLKKAKLFHSVKNISFTVKKKSVFGILGPNGCGKSTLIRMMTTLILPDTGSIKVFGVDVEEQPSRVKDFIGRVSIDASFFMKLTPLENLDYAAGLYGLDKEKSKIEAKRILQELGFPQSKLDAPVEKLSRGQQQKIAIARGFLAKPKIILLDEPTTGLDPVSKIDVLRFVKKVMKERDITIIITSHDMDEIEKLCDDLVIMNDGAVIAQGSIKELKQKYSDNNLFELQTTEPEKSKSLLEKMIKVNEIKLEVDEKKNNRLTFKTKRIDSVASEIIDALENNDIGFIGLVKILPSLEDVFVKLTGKHLE